VSIKCVPSPMGREYGFGFSASRVSSRRAQPFTSSSQGCVFLWLAFCLFAAGCGVSVQSASTASTSTAMLQASPGSVSFGDVSVGQTATNEVSLHNPSQQAVNIAQLGVTGQSFFIEGNNALPVTIAPGATYNFEVGFKPAADSAYSGELTAMDSAAQNVAQVDMRGSGGSRGDSDPSLRISTSSLNFGDVTDGSSVTQQVRLSSGGRGPVTINSVSIRGAGFSFSGPAFPVTLSHHESVTLEVKFAPTKAGTATGELVIDSNASSDSTATVSLSGTGEASTAPTTTPTLTVSTSSLGFGTVTDGSSDTLPVTLTSTGTAAVTINSVTNSGTGFSFSGATFPLTLSPKQSVILEVKFAPTTPGADTGALVIDSNSSSGPTATVSLSGTGAATTTTPTLAVSASSLSFGSVTDGSSDTLPVTLTSTGTAAVTISSVTSSGTGFSFSGGTFPLTLSPKQSVILEVKFAPTTPGADTGALVIDSNSSSKPTATVSLSGTGTAPATTPTLTLSTSSLSFGTVDDDSSDTLPVTLTSSGTSAVNISSVTISGTGFSFSGATFPLTLNSQQAVTLEVKFAPTQGVAESGSLTIKSNSSTNSTATVSLSGSGKYWVALNWSAPTSSPVAITGYNVYRATAGSTTYTLLNPSAIAGTSYSDATVQPGVGYSYYLKSVAASGAQSTPSTSVSVTIP
jgi:hypothetical protein